MRSHSNREGGNPSRGVHGGSGFMLSGELASPQNKLLAKVDSSRKTLNTSGMDNVYQKFSLTHTSTHQDSQNDLQGTRSHLILPKANIGTELANAHLFSKKELISKWSSSRARPTNSMKGESLTSPLLETKQIWKLAYSNEPSSHGLHSPKPIHQPLSTKKPVLIFQKSRIKQFNEANLQQQVRDLEKELEKMKLKYYHSTSKLGELTVDKDSGTQQNLKRIFGDAPIPYLDLEGDTSQLKESTSPPLDFQTSTQIKSLMQYNRLLSQQNAELLKENKRLKHMLASSRYFGLDETFHNKSPRVGVVSGENSGDVLELNSRDAHSSGLMVKSAAAPPSFIQVSKLQPNVIDFSSHSPISSDGFKSLATYCRDYTRMVGKSANSPFVEMIFYDTEVIELFSDLYPKYYHI